MDTDTTSRQRRRVPRSVVIAAVGWVWHFPRRPGARRRPTALRSSGGRRPAGVRSGHRRLAEPARGGLLLVAITYLVTRRRPVPDLAGRSPARRMAALELAALTGYIVAAMAVGYLLGNAIGGHPFGLHLPGPSTASATRRRWAGSSPGPRTTSSPTRSCPTWRSGSVDTPRTQLNMRSAEPPRRPAILILVILLVESVLEIATLGGPLLALDSRDAIRVIPLSFAVNFVGTVLPIAILVYGIALPRVLRLTGSVPATAIIGGFAYAAMHVFDGWAVYDSLTTRPLLTLIFLILQYFGPGLIKSVLTLRTGNVWVHVWGYHAIAPHATIDAPSIVHIFHGR